MMSKSPTPIPDRMKHLPVDARGWPITYTSFQLPDGRYDFTTSDPYKRLACITGKLCALCGTQMQSGYWFIGGPKCMQYHFFFDTAMHEECARYALVVCPYLAVRTYTGAKKRLTPDHLRVTVASSDKVKPDYFGLAMAGSYKMAILNGDDLVLAGPWLRPVEWWKDGALCQSPQW